MPNYTIIYGNTVFKIKGVDYDSTNTHRTFKKDGKLMLSIPLNSILIREESKTEVQVIPSLTPGSSVVSNPATSGGNTTVINENSGGDFLLGAVTGFVIGGLFD